MLSHYFFSPNKLFLHEAKRFNYLTGLLVTFQKITEVARYLYILVRCVAMQPPTSTLPYTDTGWRVRRWDWEQHGTLYCAPATSAKQLC
jgi:hypothetical protein